MNHQAHRVIFNKSRGCHVVVGENARSCGGNECSNVRRSSRNKRHKTTSQTLDQEAERTRIQAGSDAVVLGQNVGSIGAQVSGKTLTPPELNAAGQALAHALTGCVAGAAAIALPVEPACARFRAWAWMWSQELCMDRK